MAPVVYDWFMTEVYYWRSLACTMWSVICLPFFLFVVLLLSGFSVTHPVNWVYDTVTGLVSAQFWVSLLVLEVCQVMVIWFSLPHFTVVPEIESTLLSSCLGLIRWSRLPLLIMCSLTGALFAWSISRLQGNEFGSLTYVLSSETHERMVLNEPHMFIVLGGIFTGLTYYCHFFQHRQNYLVFPNLQRFRLFQVRSEIIPLLHTCMWESLQRLKYYYILYFLFGSIPKAWVKTSFNIDIDPEATSLNSLVGMLSLSLFWQSYLSTVMLQFSWSYARMLIRIFHTQHYEFIIQNEMEYNKEKTLPEALACSSSSLLQHLAFLDLSCVSKFSADRCQQLLSLSQPGGHPRIWASSSATALAVVKELVDRVQEENWTIMAKVSVGSQKSSHHNTGDSLSNRRPNLQPSDERQEEPLLTPLLTKLMASLSSLPVISHLITESPDASSRRLFASCQLQIWAIEALSHMAARSYMEDKYGIVQPLLPAIFGSCLDLHEAVEKHFKLSASVFRRPAGSFFSDALLRYKLHSVNKAALYRIVNTYKHHLEDLRLNPDYFKKLQPFVEYNV